MTSYGWMGTRREEWWPDSLRLMSTRMLITCDSCGAESPLGALRLYGGQMGIILRCTKCGGINVLALENGGALTLDARGARRMTYRPESNSS
jgi:hypothetical protein